MDNRLVHYQNEYYNYNDWGELKTIHQDDSKRVFAFNDSGELIESYHHSEKMDSHGIYDYDALGRRIRKTVETTKEGLTTTTKTKFVWMGMQMVEESVDRSGQEDHFTYIYRPDGSYEPLAQIKNGDEVFYYQNHINGSPNQLVDAEGHHLWEQEQTAWGKTLCDENSVLIQAHQPLRFQGQYFDEETGLHYNTFRYYNPHCGRFISQDPIGLNGGINLYQYAPNPIHWIDPWGWEKLTSGKVYRLGSKTPGNLTPRPGTDTTSGLSTTIKKPTSGKYQTLDVKTLNEGGLDVIKDGKNHASVRPKDDPDLKKLEEWADTREDVKNNPKSEKKSKYTDAVEKGCD